MVDEDPPTPIYGYGDFTGVDLLDVDWFYVTELIVKCIQDQGYPVELSGEGDGVLFQRVPGEQNELATEAFFACRLGLNLPPGDGPYAGLTRPQAERLYQHLIWLAECLEERGYPQPDSPPSFETWLESNQYWHPHNAVAEAMRRDGNMFSRECPVAPGMMSSG